jgi:hypothetical protein
MATESLFLPGALAFSRSVYSSMIDWYKVADTKGQLLLTLNGIYITVLSSVAIASPHTLVNRKAHLMPTTGYSLLARQQRAAAA